jgi:superfamily II RNA helicase
VCGGKVVTGGVAGNPAHTMTDNLLQVPDAMVAPAAWPIGAPCPEPLALPTKYELDPFQKHAVLGIHAGDHVFVTAKTGSGKTFVGEYLIARALAAGKRVFYTTPIKSLSNQKYHDLKRLFPSTTVGILTGDIKMCPDAQIVVMTAEILRNLFYKRGTATEGVGLTAAVSLEGVAGVVMDEVHYIQDPDRGHVWEESLILCPRDIQLVLLSATMPSASSLAGWLAHLHGRRTWLLSTTYRIVPLVHGVLDEREEGLRVRPVLDPKGNWLSDAYVGWIRERNARADAAAAFRQKVRSSGKTQSDVGGGGGSGTYWNRADHDAQREATQAGLRAAKVTILSPIGRLRRLVSWLQEQGAMPALFFIFSRRECERLAAQVEGSLLDSSEAAEARHIVDFHLARYRTSLEKSPQYHAIRDLLLRGIAFHHSGLNPLLKEAVEILFARGFVRALFATETFSVGLNMPTKTVVFLELEKWADGGVRRPLRPDEYIQMAGRAGRRGIDTQGLVLYEPLRDPILSTDMQSMLTGALPALESRMRFGYEFLLRLRLAAAAGRPLRIAEDSYWAVQQRLTRKQLDYDLERAEKALLALEAAVPAGVEAALSEKLELERTVAESVNAKRKKAQQALARWEVEHAHDVPKGQWPAVTERYKGLLAAREKRDLLRRDIEVWDAAPLVSVEPQEKALHAWGFLEGDALNASHPQAQAQLGFLTGLGIAATEVNEGHPILMPLFAATAEAAALTAEEIPVVLAAFLREGGDKEERGVAAVEDRFSDGVNAALNWIAGEARACEAEDGQVGYWTLSQVWPAIVAGWMEGKGLAVLAAEHDLFEGNVQRGLLKVANLLEEWGAVATVRRDLRTLERLTSLRFLRDEIVVDSLYLRM